MKTELSLSPGSRLGNYEILGPIGSGGMGEVYRAPDGRWILFDRFVPHGGDVWMVEDV